MSRERSMSAAVILWVFAALAWSVAAVSADEGPAPDSSSLINVVIADQPVASIMQILSEASGLNIIVGRDVQGVIPSVSLRNVTVEQAIRYVALSAGLFVTREEGGFIISSQPLPAQADTAPKQPAPEPAPAAAYAPAPVVPSAAMGGARPSASVALAPTVPAAATRVASARSQANVDTPSVASASGTVVSAPVVPAVPVASPRPAAAAAVPSVPGAVARIAPSVPTTAPAATPVPQIPAAAFVKPASVTPVTPAAMAPRVPAAVTPQAPVQPSPAAATLPTAPTSVPVSDAASAATVASAPRTGSAPGVPASPAASFAQSGGSGSPSGRLVAESTAGTTTISANGTVVTTIPVRYANPADLALMFGGTVAESGAMRPASYNMGRRGQSNARDARPTTEAFSAMEKSGSDSYWAQNLGGGLGRGGGGGGGGNFGGGNQGGLGGGRTGNQGGNRGGGMGGRGGGMGGAGAGMRPDGVDSIIAFMPQNSLLVSGDPAGVDKLREILMVLDQPTKQVEISTKFIEVDVTNSSAFGIDWMVSNGSTEFFQLGFAPGQAVNNVLRWAKGKFEATLGVSLSRNIGTVVNEPRVTTQNNVEAYISFYTTIPYFSATITYNQFGQRSVDFQEDEVDVEQSLYVTPRINADDTVDMYLEPVMEDQTGTVLGPNGEQVPIVTSQELGTQVRVADGETVVLGGMIRKQRKTNTLSTPLLSEIPIIGKLFQSRQEDSANSEMLVFVTPRIVRDMPAP